MLCEQFGDRYGEIYDKFPNLDWSEDLRPTAVHSGDKRDSVTMRRTDIRTYKDGTGKITGQYVRTYVYLWIPEQHPDETQWTDAQIEEKYSPLASIVEREEAFVVNDEGQLISQETGELACTPIPPEHYQLGVSGEVGTD